LSASANRDPANESDRQTPRTKIDKDKRTSSFLNK
jgi:hypothetical protein